MPRLLTALAASNALGIALADRGWIGASFALALGALSVAGGLLAWRRPQARKLLALVAAAAAGAHALARQIDAAEQHRPAFVLETTLDGSVSRVVRAHGWTTLEIERAASAIPGGPPVPERIRLSAEPARAEAFPLDRAHPGDRVRARVRLRAPRVLRNPGGRSRARDFERAGIGAVAHLVHPSLWARLPEREGWRPLAGLHRLRRRATERLSERGPGAGLLRALALGDRAGLPPHTREAFARLGLAHLLAVSGLHLLLAAALLYALARFLLVRIDFVAARWDVRAPALALALAGSLVYALFAGWAVPVRRAFVLLLALAAALATRRPRLRAPPLALAALAVLSVEPQALFALGAQLSFAASAALLTGAARAPKRAPGRRLARRLDEGLRTAATALAATAPLLALHGRVTGMPALATNLVGVPWTAFVLLPASLLAAIASLLPGIPGAEPVLALAERIAAATLFAVEAGAALLPGTGEAARPALPWIAAAMALGVAAARARATRTRVGLALAIGAVLSLAPPAPIEPPPPRVVFFDVGQGDATLVQGRAASVLVDAGRALAGGADLGRREVLPALRALGVEALDLVLATHADLDHRGGLASVLGAMPVGALWLPRGARADPAFESLLGVARARGVPVLERGAGSPVWRAGDLSVAPLWPPESTAGASRNDRSLVVRIEVAGRRVLLAGDIEAGAERALLASGADLRADLLKLSHHGSRTSSTRAFLSAVGAQVMVASAPCQGRFPMPHPEVVARARSLGASVWWTGRDGAVLVGVGEPLHVRGWADAPESC